jgi:hypothetical protein
MLVSESEFQDDEDLASPEIAFDDTPQPEEYDASNPKHVAIARRVDNKRKRFADEGFKEVLSYPQSRAWLWSLLEDCGIFSSTFSENPSASAFNEGKRSLGLRLTADLMRLAPEMFSTMMKENKDKVYG